jgi:zinc protease
MRTVIVANALPKGTVQVRLDVATGSLDETARERGFAHFVEHMAFNGSTHVPEGEMVRLLERKGLAFGADTNAQTSFEQTTYMLDLPRNDADLIDTALMLMRETASELTFSPTPSRANAAWCCRNCAMARAMRSTISRPARVLLSQGDLSPAPADRHGGDDRRRDRTGPQGFLAAPLRARQDHAGGDRRCRSGQGGTGHRRPLWRLAGGPAPARPDQGKVLPGQKGQTDVWTNPALAERVTVARHGRWLDEPDTIANRRENLLRQIGYGIVNRRFQTLSRRVDAPFRGAGLGTSDVFKIGRTTNLIVDTVDGGWARGLSAAATVWREAMAKGFTQAEVDEQVANVRTGIENAAAAENTRSNGALVNLALSLLHDDMVPTTPASGLARFNAFASTITPANVMAALRREAVPLDHPLIRFQGRKAPAGGAAALRHTGRPRWPPLPATSARPHRLRLYRFRHAGHGGGRQHRCRARHPPHPFCQRGDAQHQAHRAGGRSHSRAPVARRRRDAGNAGQSAGDGPGLKRAGRGPGPL